MRGSGSQPAGQFRHTSHVKPSFWLRRRAFAPEVSHVMSERGERRAFVGLRSSEVAGYACRGHS